MQKEKLNKNVIFTGFTSLFTDISSEMIYPLIQAFMTTILKNQTALIGPILGTIEGIAESTASILKLFSGYLSDKIKKRKILAIIGYALSGFGKILFFIPNWISVFSARLLDRVGKGIRTAPRDALISDSVKKEEKGKSFGFQRAMDFTGAFLGTLFSVLLIRFVFTETEKYSDPKSFFPIFGISICFAFIAIIFLFFTRENISLKEKKASLPAFNLKGFNKPLKIFFLAQFIFTLGNSSNQFLLLRSTNLGYTLSYVTLMYLIFNLVPALFSLPFGAISDKLGRKKILILGYFIYGIVYLAFGFITPQTKWLLWFFWIIYGIYYAMTEGVEKAYISDLAPRDFTATAIGFHQMIVGLTLLPASIIAGIMYSIYKPLPFIFGGIMAVINCIIMLFGTP